MAFKRSAVRSRLSPPRDLEREFRVFFFFAARPRFQRFHDFGGYNDLHEMVLSAFRGNRWGRGNRDFVAIVGIVVCVETVISLKSLETWLRQAGPNRYRVRVSAAARFALLSPRAFPLRHSPLTLPVTRLRRPVFAAQVAACLQIWTAAPTPSRLLLPQAAA